MVTNPFFRLFVWQAIENRSSRLKSSLILDLRRVRKKLCGYCQMPKRCAATAKKACGNYHNVVRRGAFRNVVTAKTLCEDCQNGVRFYQYGVRLLPKRRAVTTESLWGDLC